MAPCSSPAVSCRTTLIGRPFTPPRSLKNFSASIPPFFCSSPSRATLLVVAMARPIGIGWPERASPGDAAPAAALAAGWVALDEEAALAAGAVVAAGAAVAPDAVVAPGALVAADA